jgi:hypothetical protein
MAAPIQWLPKLPRIIEELSALPAPVVDRATMETLFGVGRRRAHELMARFSSGRGYTAGKTVLLDRQDLLAQLRALEETPDVQWEHQRRAKVSAAVGDIRRHAAASRISVVVPAKVVETTLDDLPEGVQLRPGILTVEFSTGEELVARLFALSQALVNDYEGLERLVKR